jgi:hypothetical protein
MSAITIQCSIKIQAGNLEGKIAENKNYIKSKAMDLCSRIKTCANGFFQHLKTTYSNMKESVKTLIDKAKKLTVNDFRLTISMSCMLVAATVLGIGFAIGNFHLAGLSPLIAFVGGTIAGEKKI